LDFELKELSLSVEIQGLHAHVIEGRLEFPIQDKGFMICLISRLDDNTKIDYCHKHVLLSMLTKVGKQFIGSVD
jgi:hypothetical protein